MQLLNLGSGGVRPSDPWVNMDLVGVDAHNFIRHDLRLFPWPIANESFDGIIATHVFEHFDAIDLQRILRECYRILKKGGVLRCGVPDAAHFRKVHVEDTRTNAVRLFGEPLSHPDFNTFMGWALFLYCDHRQVFTEDSLWCTLANREYPPHLGTPWFAPQDIQRAPYQESTRPDHYCATILAYLDNRPEFSLYMEAFK